MYLGMRDGNVGVPGSILWYYGHLLRGVNMSGIKKVQWNYFPSLRNWRVFGRAVELLSVFVLDGQSEKQRRWFVLAHNSFESQGRIKYGGSHLDLTPCSLFHRHVYL